MKEEMSGNRTTQPSRNARRQLWNKLLKPKLPMGLMLDFFSEIFGNSNLEFCWDFFHSLYSMF
jgi:hypothetical protein